MKVGDTVRLKGTEYLGTVTGKFSDNYYWVRFACYSNSLNKFKDTEIEFVSAAPIVNPCVCCGAETPEGRQVCGACDKS